VKSLRHAKDTSITKVSKCRGASSAILAWHYRPDRLGEITTASKPAQRQAEYLRCSLYPKYKFVVARRVFWLTIGYSVELVVMYLKTRGTYERPSYWELYLQRADALTKDDSHEPVYDTKLELWINSIR
jgi:hypothetical protein